MATTEKEMTVLSITTTPAEREGLSRIMDEFDYTQDEIHLVCWYIGYRFVLDCADARKLSDGPPTRAEIQGFIDRQQLTQH